MTFQTADVMVHQLHDDHQLETFKKVLAGFDKADYVGYVCTIPKGWRGT